MNINDDHVLIHLHIKNKPRMMTRLGAKYHRNSCMYTSLHTRDRNEPVGTTLRRLQTTLVPHAVKLNLPPPYQYTPDMLPPVQLLTGTDLDRYAGRTRSLFPLYRRTHAHTTRTHNSPEVARDLPCHEAWQLAKLIVLDGTHYHVRVAATISAMSIWKVPRVGVPTAIDIKVVLLLAYIGFPAVHHALCAPCTDATARRARSSTDPSPPTGAQRQH